MWSAGNLISVRQIPKSVFIEISGPGLIYVIWFSLEHLPWEEAGGRCLTSRRMGRPWFYFISPNLHAVEEALSPLSWLLQYCHERDFNGENQAFFFCGIMLGGCPQPFYVSWGHTGKDNGTPVWVGGTALNTLPLWPSVWMRSGSADLRLASLPYVLFMEPGLSRH